MLTYNQFKAFLIVALCVLWCIAALSIVASPAAYVAYRVVNR
jgi:hypothetical protein